MKPNNANPKILLLHDNELVDVRGLLSDLAIKVIERPGKLTDVDLRTKWDLIIASQKRISDFEKSAKVRNATRIAVIDNDSRTLRSMLRRLGVEYVVARPVHATALRLLVLHCVYRGPERRRLSRVSVGAKVQVRVGLFRKDVILADLSLHGCRLVCEKPIKAGTKIKLMVPPEMAAGKAFSLPVRALRSGAAADSGQGYVMAGAFHSLTPALGQRLRKVFEAYRNGPARLSGATIDMVSQPGSDEPPERRTAPRKDYEKHVVTVTDEATRVLLCRDISIGGMRVEPNDSLVPGDDLLVAIHIRSRAEPLVVNTRVSRDDGEKGLILEFYDLSKESEVYLNKMVHLLPMLGVKDAGKNGDQPGMIISEIIQRRAS
ncbi:MAG: PilZ domain-containing protein [Deltaproteobacteria bacterium]|nr:PilZ domain-containing protein [Deltaproteobacteria bacterium]